MSHVGGGEAPRDGLFENMEMMMSEVVYDSSRSPKDNIENMRQYFRIVEKGTQRQFWCLKCKQGWGLPKDNKHPGNYLHLLNHAYGHIKK